MINIFVITDIADVAERVKCNNIRSIGRSGQKVLNDSSEEPLVLDNINSGISVGGNFYLIEGVDVFEQLEALTSPEWMYEPTQLKGDCVYLIMLRDETRSKLLSSAFSLTNSMVYRLFFDNSVCHIRSQFDVRDSSNHSYMSDVHQLIYSFLAGSDYIFDGTKTWFHG